MAAGPGPDLVIPTRDTDFLTRRGNLVGRCKGIPFDSAVPSGRRVFPRCKVACLSLAGPCAGPLSSLRRGRGAGSRARVTPTSRVKPVLVRAAGPSEPESWPGCQCRGPGPAQSESESDGPMVCQPKTCASINVFLSQPRFRSPRLLCSLPQTRTRTAAAAAAQSLRLRPLRPSTWFRVFKGAVRVFKFTLAAAGPGRGGRSSWAARPRAQCRIADRHPSKRPAGGPGFDDTVS
jgi:hypothetical protein